MDAPVRRRAAVFASPMVVGLIAAQKAAPHVRTVDFILLFASGVLMGLIQFIRASRRST
jgi:hypothetical protein